MSTTIPPAASNYQLLHIHDSRVPEVVVSLAVCLPAAYIAVVLRFISRRIGRIPLKADDWWIVVGLIFTTAYVACAAVATHLGLGRHEILVKEPVVIAKVVIAKEVIYNPAIVAIKTSILLLYRRVFTERCYNSSFNMTLWCTGAFVLSYSICQAVLTVFYCTPVAALWDHRIKGAKCIDFDVALIVLSSLNIGTDILILCLPVPQLWKLTMSTRQKCQLTGIFSLGGFVCIASIIRVPYIAHISLVDQTWSDIDGLIWSGAELNLAIVSACLPTLRPLFLRVFHGGYKTGASCQSPSPDGLRHGEKVLVEDEREDKGSMGKEMEVTVSECF